MNAPPRPPLERVRDTIERLRHDVDCWVATADPETGMPYLVPLSFVWDGSTLLISTPGTSITARNLAGTGRARIGVGPTRDVVLLDAIAEPPVLPEDLATDVADRFAARTGFDPRQFGDQGYVYLRLRPVRIQAWREANELEGRDVLRDGGWVADPG